MPSPAKPLSLREAYEVYKSGGHLGRNALFGIIVDEIESLKERIGSVDEAAVAALDNRLSSLETVIGNALTKAGDPTEINAIIDESVPYIESMPARSRGRPRKVPEAT